MKPYIKVTDWKHMLDRPGKVCQAVTCVVIETKKGELIKLWRCMNSVLTYQQSLQCARTTGTYTSPILPLEEIKKNILLSNLESNIEDLIGTRIGIRGRRGYFKVVNLYILQEKGGEDG